MLAAQHVLRYLRGTYELGIRYHRDAFHPDSVFNNFFGCLTVCLFIRLFRMGESDYLYDNAFVDAFLLIAKAGGYESWKKEDEIFSVFVAAGTCDNLNPKDQDPVTLRTTQRSVCRWI